MPLAALIIVSDEGEPGAVLPATLMLAGQSLFAYQVRMAHAAGARHIVALIDQLPAPLVAALDTLREEGIGIEIARDARDAADRIHPDEHLLVMAGPVVADEATVRRIAEAAQPGLLCWPLDAAPAGAERIDGTTAWSGLGLLDGRMLRETAAMVGDWALGSTLLRTALQQGAVQVAADESQGHVSLPRSTDAAAATARQLAALATETGEGPVATVTARLLSLMAPRLVTLTVPWTVYVVAPAVLYGLAAVLGISGFLAWGLGLFLIVPVLLGAARLVGAIGGRRARLLTLAEGARLPLAMVLIALAGWEFSFFPGGWGPLALSVWAASALALAALPGVSRRWFPEPEGMAAMLLLALLAGFPVAGLVACTLYGLAAQIARARLSERT